MSKEIFVFGSNTEGRHGKGAALTARMEYGAVNGRHSGLQGNSYAIITKELRPWRPKVTLGDVSAGVANFLDFALKRPDLTFLVTPIGCGLAGFKPEEIAPLFRGHPQNVILPEEFEEWTTSALR